MPLIRVLAAAALVAGLVACAESSTTEPRALHSSGADLDAIVVKTGLCNMVGADENGNLISGGTAPLSTKIENGNKVIVTCNGDNITNLSGHAVVFTDFTCRISQPSTGEFVFTNQSRATVSASGYGSITCIFTK
jgi:hypothetical protein